MSFTEPTSALDVLRIIASGEVDEQIDAIGDAIRRRKHYLQGLRAAENQATLTPGTRVMLCGNLSPKYLLGEEGIVSPDPTKRSGTIKVIMDRSVGRYSKVLEIPAECLRKVS